MPKWEREFSLPASVAGQFRAMAAIEYLIDHDQFFLGSKNDFAHAMDWVDRDGKPRRAWVEDVCTLTREQATNGLVATLGGFVVSYAPTKGGMVLWTDDEAPLEHYVHMFTGDMQRERQHRTENRRRLPYWRKAAEVAHASGDVEISRLCNHAENEIENTGFISEGTTARLMKVFASRGMYGENGA